MGTNNSWNSPSLTTDGQVLIGKTSTGFPVANTITAGSGINVTNGSGTITLSSFNAVAQQQIYYVGKHGNDTNSGLNVENAVLTFGQAIILAVDSIPSATNRFTILCFDDGIYTENITLPSYVDLCACNAELDGTIDLNDNQSIKLRSQHVATGLNGITQNSGGTAYIAINEIICDGIANWIECLSGFVGIYWENAVLDSGTCFNANGGDITLNGGVIQISGLGTVITGSSSRTIAGSFASVAGGSNGICINANAPMTVDLTVSAAINCDSCILITDPSANINLSINSIDAATNVYNMSDGYLNLLCNQILGGGRTVTGGIEQVTVANPMGTVGQIWQSKGTGIDPGWATLSAGTGTSISNTTGSITVNSVGGGLTWTDVTGTSQAMAINSGYTANNAGLVTLTLPATAAYGSVISVVGKGTGLWKIAQQAGQTIHFGATDTTTGVTGNITATNKYDTVHLLTTIADTDFTVISSIGNMVAT